VTDEVRRCMFNGAVKPMFDVCHKNWRGWGDSRADSLGITCSAGFVEVGERYR